MVNNVQYVTQDKLDKLHEELRVIKEETIRALAKRIDEARQMGDLSENAEYHAAREEMAWAQSRAKECEAIINQAELISESGTGSGVVEIGSTLVVKSGGNKKEFKIVGAQEADPLKSKISNESPLGEAFLGKKIGDSVQVEVPAGVQTYKILEVS
jgi:transcription elongation factor GreA